MWQLLFYIYTQTLQSIPLKVKYWSFFSLSFFVINPSFGNHVVDSLSQILNIEKDDDKKVDLLLDIAEEYFYTNPSIYLDYAFKAFDITNLPDFNNDSLKIETAFSLGSSYAWVGDTSKAFLYFQQALNKAKLLPYRLMEASIYGERGMAFGSIGVIDKAMVDFKKSLEISYAIKDTLGIIASNNNIGIIYLDLEEYDKAKEYFESNAIIERSKNILHGLAISMSNLGDVAYGKKQYREAIKHYKQSLHIVDSLELDYGIMENHIQLAKVYEKQNLIELALSYNDIAYKIAQKAGFKKEQGSIALSISKIKLQEKEYKQSLSKAKEALFLSENISSNQDIASIYQVLSKNHEAIGNFKQSLYFHKQYEAQRDKFVNQERTKIFAELEIQFQNKRKEAENQFLKKEQVKNKTIIRQRTIISSVIGIGTLLLAFLSFNLFQKSRKEQESNQLLEQKVKARTQHLNETNGKLKKVNAELERFAYITSHDLKEPLRNISSFSTLILKDLEAGNMREFKNYFQFIIKNTRQMDTLINDVLLFSNIDKDKNANKMLTLSQILDRVKSDLNTTIKNKRAQIIYDSPELYQTTKNINIPFQLSIVFKNLIENGIKYNKDPFPTIWINYREDQSNMHFSIRDNGIGISEAYHQYIFEMFKRLHNREEYEGSGIGLAICKKILYNLGGSLTVNSSLEKGSVFQFSFPITTPVNNKIITKELTH